MALHCIRVDPTVAIARGLFDWLAPGDAVLLLGATSTLAQIDHAALSVWLAQEVTLHALADELALLGIDFVDPRVQVTDYTGWVDLVVEHPQQLMWA